MAYPRNAASPPPVAIGAVVQISDGAVQTTGVTVYHRTSSTTENSGGGTTNVGATTGTIYYTPTQAETNYESFELVAWKTGCIPACVTVVTSASATAGVSVIPDTQKVDVNTIKTQTITCSGGVTVPAATLASTTNITSANGVTLTPTTGLGTQTANITGNLSGSVGSVTAGVALTAGERTTLAAAIEAAIINELDGTAVMQAIADLIASDMTTTDLTVAAIASAARDAILNRVLAGNHDTVGSVGKVLQDVLEDTGTTIPATLTTITGYVDCLPVSWVTVPTAAQNSTQVASDLATAHGAGSWATATGFSTHSAADVVTALGTGSTLTALATAANLATLDTLVDRMAPLLVGTVTGAGTGTEVYAYGGVTATVTVDVDGNVSGVVFS